MAERTAFLSKLIGLYCILVGLAMTAHRQATLETMAAILRDPSMILVLGVFTLALGLAMVLAHNVWSGGALAVVVTLVGWLTLVKGGLFLFLPRAGETRLFLKDLRYDRLFYLYMGITIAIGVFLTYGGFISDSKIRAKQ